MDLPLTTVVYTIGKVAGTRAVNLTSRSHMLYALQCMEPTIFNSCEGMLLFLKSQLNKCKRGTLKQFGYRAVVVSFILQRVPHMRPQVTITRLDPEDPRILAWVTTMPRLGGEGPKFNYNSGFFRWLRNQLLMVEDYAYEGADFRNGSELVLPKGEVWDERGKKTLSTYIFLILYLFYFYVFYSTEINKNSMQTLGLFA